MSQLLLYCCILGDYVLYWSFDTLENLTLMRGNGNSQRDYDALVPGQVNIIFRVLDLDNN